MATSDKPDAAPHLLVVIDHQEARVYRTEVHGSIPSRSPPTTRTGSVGTCIPPTSGPMASVSPSERASTSRLPRRCKGPNKFCCSGAARAGAVRWRCCSPT